MSASAAAKREQFANRLWYGRHWLRFLLWPLSILFIAAAAARRVGYRSGLLRSFRAPVPVIIVGNLTVGGTGKTPIVIWLAQALVADGFAPAILSRGYGAESAGNCTRRVSAESTPQMVGDEPLLLARKSQVPVFVDTDRGRAAAEAVANGADVLISDDGLQHYALQRDFELVIVDGERGFGNGMRLPAGPLRESPSRLQQVERVLVNGGPEHSLRVLDPFRDKTSPFQLVGQDLVRVDESERRPLSSLRDEPTTAIAGIGNPERFFAALRRAGLDPATVAIPDHAPLTQSELQGMTGTIVMTEKDAVKCREIADERCWYLPVEVSMQDNSGWLDDLVSRIRQKRSAS